MSRLAEPAAPGTAPEQLYHGTVKHNFRGGNHKAFRIIHVIQILYNAFLDKCRCTILRGDSLDCAILVVCDLIQRRYIDTGNMADLPQEFLLAPALPLGLTVHVGKFDHDLLAVTNLKGIHKGRQRFRVIRTGSATDHEIFQCFPITGPHRNAAQIQHI